MTAWTGPTDKDFNLLPCSRLFFIYFFEVHTTLKAPVAWRCPRGTMMSAKPLAESHTNCQCLHKTLCGWRPHKLNLYEALSRKDLNFALSVSPPYRVTRPAELSCSSLNHCRHCYGDCVDERPPKA